MSKRTFPMDVFYRNNNMTTYEFPLRDNSIDIGDEYFRINITYPPSGRRDPIGIESMSIARDGEILSEGAPSVFSGTHEEYTSLIRDVEREHKKSTKENIKKQTRTPESTSKYKQHVGKIATEGFTAKYDGMNTPESHEKIGDIIVKGLMNDPPRSTSPNSFYDNTVRITEDLIQHQESNPGFLETAAQQGYDPENPDELRAVAKNNADAGIDYVFGSISEGAGVLDAVVNNPNVNIDAKRAKVMSPIAFKGMMRGGVKPETLAKLAEVSKSEC